jgi:hypothetical protein
MRSSKTVRLHLVNQSLLSLKIDLLSENLSDITTNLEHKVQKMSFH